MSATQTRTQWKTLFPPHPRLKHCSWLLCLAALAAVSLRAQTFQTIPSLSFTKAYAGANPLSQVIGVASTGANFDFYVKAVSLTGGSWLTVDDNGNCCNTTPAVITVTTNPAVTLAAGTYTGQVLVTSDPGGVTMTIPVSLVIEPSTATFFDEFPGGLTYSMITGGTAPPAQPLQIRNAGAGTLTWTASTTTADGGAWLKLSAAAGTAPSTLSVSVIPANLPGTGLTPGTFIGQVVLATSGDRVTIPITFTVGASVFRQIEPLNFTKVYAGGNPLPQFVTVASTGAGIDFYISAVNGTGGNWLTLDDNGNCCNTTTTVIAASVNPAITLAAGTYTAEIIVKSSTRNDSIVVPVTLNVESSTSTFFDEFPGGLTYSMITGGTAPPAQPLQIRNAGTGTLTWTASATTADGGAWLKLSAAAGTAPSTLNVSVIPADLPGTGLTSGTFIGQVVLVTSGDRVTIPIAVTVGPSVFTQIEPLNFTKVYAGANPLPQFFTVASTGSSIDFYVSAVNGTGGNWLTVDDNGNCCDTTTSVLTASVDPAITLAAGTYTAEIIVRSSNRNDSIVVPVTLTVESPAATFFDEFPGGLTYSMVTGGTAPPAQPLQIRNAGAGTLTWTASTSTADGGSWLKLSAATGTAPSTLSVSVIPANLPGTGLTPGTFTGQVVLATSGDRVTIPITFTVGASVFEQIEPLNFTKAYAGGNPLPQFVTVASTGSNIAFYVSAVNGTGGNWLTVDDNGNCCDTTTSVITATVNPAITLAAGTYTAEIIVKSSTRNDSLIVPVTLTVESSTSTFFDEFPGGLTYSTVAGGPALAAQPLQIRNAGTGTLNWTASATTADGGAWLKLSAAAGTAPSTLNVSVVPAYLPGTGLTPGTFTGQVVLVTSGDRVTIPIIVTVGPSVFNQIPALAFSKALDGTNPTPQAITVTSTGSNIAFYISAVNGTGGNWLTVNDNGNCCDTTPSAITVSATPAATLAAGVYVAELLLKSSTRNESMVIPVTLTVNGTTRAATPVFTPPGGTYSATQSVVITDSTPGAGIYYTTDGTTPTTSSTPYSVPIQVTKTETINAISAAPGYPQSALGSAAYIITAPTTATPAVTQTIAITDTTPGATVYYTTDGTTPTQASTIYTGPLVLNASAVLKFIAIAPNFEPSAVRTVTTKIQ